MFDKWTTDECLTLQKQYSYDCFGIYAYIELLSRRNQWRIYEPQNDSFWQNDCFDIKWQHDWFDKLLVLTKLFFIFYFDESINYDKVIVLTYLVLRIPWWNGRLTIMCVCVFVLQASPRFRHNKNNNGWQHEQTGDGSLLHAQLASLVRLPRGRTRLCKEASGEAILRRQVGSKFDGDQAPRQHANGEWVSESSGNYEKEAVLHKFRRILNTEKRLLPSLPSPRIYFLLRASAPVNYYCAVPDIYCAVRLIKYADLWIRKNAFSPLPSYLFLALCVGTRKLLYCCCTWYIVCCTFDKVCYAGLSDDEKTSFSLPPLVVLALCVDLLRPRFHFNRNTSSSGPNEMSTRPSTLYYVPAYIF